MLFADQWNNLDNAKAHYKSTGPEIWEQTGGKIDGFVCSVGSGGTLAGTSRFLKEKNKDVRIACADPHGAGMYEYFRTGDAKATPGGSITEGIGLNRATAIVESAKVDDAYLIPDAEAVTVIYELLQHEGLCLGGSTGINVAGAMRLAKQLGPGKTIVTVLCDSGSRYQSKLFNAGLHARQEPSGAGMAGEAQQHQAAVRLASRAEPSRASDPCDTRARRSFDSEGLISRVRGGRGAP